MRHPKATPETEPPVGLFSHNSISPCRTPLRISWKQKRTHGGFLVTPIPPRWRESTNVTGKLAPLSPRARRQLRSSHPVDICARRDPSLRRNIWKNLTPSVRRRSYCIRRDPLGRVGVQLVQWQQVANFTTEDKTRVMTSGVACVERGASAVKFDRPAKWSQICKRSNRETRTKK